MAALPNVYDEEEEGDGLPAGNDIPGWAALRRLDLAANDNARPKGVLLHYQSTGIETIFANSVTIVEKGRRIGFTWGVAAGSVLHAGKSKAAGGSDVLYIGYSLDMAREFIDAAGDFARAFEIVCESVEEFLFADGSKEGVQALRIKFASGYDIVALTSKPRSLRGRQGVVIIDEAAFHDDLPAMMKAALALLIWGGRVVLISTHDGAGNYFNQLIQDARAGRKPYKVIRVTFDDALRQGLYMRICEVKGETWSPEAEAAWRAKVYAEYGDDADEELQAIPRASGGKYFTRVLIEARSSQALPVIRFKAPDGFVLWGEGARTAYMNDWMAEHLDPLLADLHPALRSALGQDFGRSSDLTVYAPIQITERLGRRIPFLLELRDCPFDQQRQVLHRMLERLPRLGAASFDAGGNGMVIAEWARQKWAGCTAIRLNANWYAEHFPKLKGAFEDGSLEEMPADSEVVDDFLTVEVVDGVPRVPPAKRTKGQTGKRHGDAAVAIVLAYEAASRVGSTIGGVTSGVVTGGGALGQFVGGGW